jgi:signal transduction histidine kinase
MEREPARTEPGRPVDAWNRGGWAWNAAVYLLIGCGTLLALADGTPTGSRRMVMLVLAGLLTAWYWSSIRLGLYADEEGSSSRLGRLRWGTRVWAAAGLLTVVVVLWGVLAWLHPAFYVLLFGLYPMVYRSLPLRQAIGFSVGLTAAVVGLEVASSGRPLTDNWPALVSGVLSAGFGVLFALWITGIIEQSHERRKLIEQLEATRAELAAAEREAGRLGERQRLAREIHDTLTQGFVSIVLLLQAAESELPPDATAARDRLELARRAARENLAEARRLVWELRPESLRAASLGEALGRLADRLAEETGVAATATVTGTPRPLPADAEVTLVRVTQEALANVRQHAAASRVALTLSYMDGETVLDVRDDGVGFAASRNGGREPGGADGGFGLRAMRERVAALGGSLAVESAAGAGTTVAVTLPTGQEEPCPASGC